MAGIIINLLTVAVVVLSVCGPKQIEKEIHRPYGIRMCEELGQKSTDCFIYRVETLTCCRVPSNDFITHALKRNSTGTCVLCPKEIVPMNINSTALAVAPRDDLYTQQSKETSLASTPSSNVQPYTTPAQTAVQVMTVNKKEDTSLAPAPSRDLQPYTTTALTSVQVVTAGKKKDVTETKGTTLHESTTNISQTGEPVLSKEIENITLHQACTEGRLGVVKYILSEGLQDINCQDEKGWTPVMAAAGGKQNTVFNFLLSHGCDLSVLNDDSNNILHVACEGGDIGIVRKLIDDQKYDIDSRGRDGWTSVMFAAFYGNRGVVDLLVHKGCNLTIVNDFEDNLLHVACRGGNVHIVKYMVKFIISKHIVSINIRGFHRRTPVMMAAEAGHIVVVDLLAKEGCHMKALDQYKNNLLHVACIGGHVDMVQHIINQNIFSIESKEERGRTPVLIAAGYGHVEVVDLLVRKGCNLGEVDKYKYNVLHIACYKGYSDVAKYIIQLNIVDMESRGFNGRTAVMLAVERGHIEMVDLLTSKGCSLHVVDNDKNTVLHAACLGGHVDMVKYIISKNIVNINVRGFDKKTPVMVAAEMGHVRVVMILMKQGCDMQTVDANWNNILHIACIDGHVDMVKYLIRLGIVSRRKVNKFCDTPIQFARQYGHGEVVALLKAGK